MGSREDERRFEPDAMTRNRTSLILFFALLLFGMQLPSCASVRGVPPNIADLYREAAKIETRNPVIVIHGILGARLEERETGRSVWGAFGGDSVHPNTPDGARLIGLPLEIPASAFDYDPATAAVHAAGPLDAIELSFFFKIIAVEVYASILRSLGVGGYLDPVSMDPSVPQYPETHFTCFTFFYDWRRDNVENAIRLGHFLTEKRHEIAEHLGRRVAILREAGHDEEARELLEWHAGGYKFDIVAHSMGGLIARYFLRFGAHDLPPDGSAPAVTWAGAREIDRLVCVGTPSFGAIEALENLHDGFELSFLLPHFRPEILGTMPAIYQLLPRTRHGVLIGKDDAPIDVDLFDPTVWRENAWGLARDDADEVLQHLLPKVGDAGVRRARALAYQAWCLRRARQFHAAIDRVPEGDVPAEIYLFAADTQQTKTRAVLERSRGRLIAKFDERACYAYGDATVPRYSAVADERMGGPSRPYLRSPVPWADVVFVSDDHIGLTSNPHFTNNLLYLLLERPSDRLPRRGSVPKPPPSPHVAM